VEREERRTGGVALVFSAPFHLIWGNNWLNSRPKRQMQN
jgi:hypothetical protein